MKADGTNTIENVMSAWICDRNWAGNDESLQKELSK